MLNGQPVGYASRTLTTTEFQYAQIEKKLLVIAFACDHFETYTIIWTRGNTYGDRPQTIGDNNEKNVE